MKLDDLKAKFAALPKRYKIIFAGVVVFIILATAANAQSNCGPKDNIFASLSSQYQERPVASGISGPAQIQFWANEATGTWSIVVVSPNGGACLVAEGENYETIAPEPNV